MKKLSLIFLIILLAKFVCFGQQEALTQKGERVLLFKDKTWTYADSLLKPANISSLEIPETNSRDVVINHLGYSLLFDDKRKESRWVAYELTDEETRGIYTRFDKFITDPLVKSGTANDKDYTGSGYDRGHLAPAADMLWSLQAMKESFYYSNMSPQVPGFNRGIWKNLESLVRDWAVENKDIYVVTGPVFSPGDISIGKNKVDVPKYFYKVILDYSMPDIKGIGFILPNASSNAPLQNYAVSIDSVESVTGINFFPQLPDDQEKLIEKTLDLNSWNWNGSGSNSQKASIAVQCEGITKAGIRCKNKTTNASGYCYLHEDQDQGSIKEQSEKASNSYSGNQQIQTGPRGGQYYINKNGNKTYLRKK